MKFALSFLQKINLSFLKATHIWALGIVLVVVLTFVASYAKLSLGQKTRIQSAMDTGQRLEIIISTGEIIGKIFTSKKEQKSEEETAENQEDSDTTEKEETNSELKWMSEDFIGPPMSEEMIAVLTTNDTAELEAQIVSVKEALGDKPVIVLIVKGIGLSASTAELAMELPKNVTLGLSAYSPSIEKWLNTATESGHEIILNIPMETKDYNYNDPGPYSLTTNGSEEDNLTSLKRLLSLIQGYEAVYSETEEIFTRSTNSITPILKHLKEQKKYFVYGGGYSNFSLIQIADSIEYPLLINDILLDTEISPSSINKKFREIESSATKQGYVVVMAHPYPITIRMIKRWLPEAEKRGYRIAPISELLGKVFVD